MGSTKGEFSTVTRVSTASIPELIAGAGPEVRDGMAYYRYLGEARRLTPSTVTLPLEG
jgi:hypothetical protein